MALDTEVNVRHTGTDYKALLSKDANSHTVLLGYAQFLEKCLNDTIEAEKTCRKSEKLRMIDDQSGGFGEGEDPRARPCLRYRKMDSSKGE
jgi:hypothetical protein